MSALAIFLDLIIMSRLSVDPPTFTSICWAQKFDL